MKTKKSMVKLALKMAKEVRPIFEAEYPGDTFPEKSLAAVMAYLYRPCKKTKKAAYAAAGGQDKYIQSIPGFAAASVISAAAYAAAMDELWGGKARVAHTVECAIEDFKFAKYARLNY